jgi:chitinase
LYLITAEAEPVQDEVDTVDNTLQFDGAVAVFTYPVQFPVASFTLSPTNPLIGETVTLDGSSSSDPDGNIVSYQWDFGDGNTGSGPTTTHVYSTIGNYTVTLTVTDNDGLFDNDRKHVLVRKNPIASFTFSPANPLVGETVTFDAAASTPEGGAIISYKWDFGDTTQTTRNDATVTHVFSAKGTYVVTLTVTDDEGLTGTMTKQIPVEESSTPSLLPLEIVLALVIVAAVAVAVAVMLLSRRRV